MFSLAPLCFCAIDFSFKKLVQARTICLALLFAIIIIPSTVLAGLMNAAIDDAVVQLLHDLQSSAPAGLRIAVTKVEDDPDGVVRDLVIAELSGIKKYTIAGDREEIDRVLTGLYEQLDRRDLYDESTLEQMGKLTSPQALLRCRVLTREQSSNAAHITLVGKLIRIQSGAVLWSGRVQGRAFQRLTVGQIVWRSVLLMVLLLLFFIFYKSRQTVLYYHRKTMYWFIVSVLWIFLIWVFIIKFLF